MRENIASRFVTLLEEGRRLQGMLEYSEKGGLMPLVPSSYLVDFQTWVASMSNLIDIIILPSSPYRAEVERALTHDQMQYGLPSSVFQKLLGLLISAKQEWDAGLLRKVEYIVIAEAFDDFLDHAAGYHRGNKKIEASVLASVVLEDTVKRISKKNGIDPSGKSLEELIDELTKSSVFTPVKAKQYKSYATVRNSALHAEWDKFDIRDVGKLIDGTHEIIRDYL